MASEMLYPILPIYLQSIGFSIVLIGVLEGFAEAMAGLSKGYFGKLSDNSGKRVPFVQLGYTISALSKPLMAVLILPFWIFLLRTLDRLGKGIRTGARDAILSEEATPQTKGKIFGFHRSMDTLGAVIGPGLALVYLYYYPENYKTLFYFAAVPGVLAILATFYLKDKRDVVIIRKRKTSFFSFLNYWKESPEMYRKVVLGLLIFALVNSSDVFLLLKAKQAGIDDPMIIGFYIFYNLIYAIFAFPLGVLADKIGLPIIYIIGLLLFTSVYFSMANALDLPSYFISFFIYGIFAATTDGISKAWISNIVKTKDTATAIGTYSGFQSICALLASGWTGLVWFYFGSGPAFIATGSVTLLVALYFIILLPKRDKLQKV
mgnify:CR=1 FL=1|tara:strand:- start:17385 stop:18512 length:1128 start_codon:yes stop_codon:yes gene_type:complete